MSYLKETHLGDTRGARLREDLSRLNLQISQAEADLADQSELYRDMMEIMKTGAVNVRVTAALEVPFIRDAQEKALHKVKKLKQDREELKGRLEAYNALRRYVHES